MTRNPEKIYTEAHKAPAGGYWGIVAHQNEFHRAKRVVSKSGGLLELPWATEEQAMKAARQLAAKMFRAPSR